MITVYFLLRADFVSLMFGPSTMFLFILCSSCSSPSINFGKEGLAGRESTEKKFASDFFRVHENIKMFETDH
jgi:hypothetical protein